MDPHPDVGEGAGPLPDSSGAGFLISMAVDAPLPDPHAPGPDHDRVVAASDFVADVLRRQPGLRERLAGDNATPIPPPRLSPGAR